MNKQTINALIGKVIALKAEAAANGGFTVTPELNKADFVSGYFVAYPESSGMSYKIPLSAGDHTIAHMLADLIVKTRDSHAYIGGWIDDGYLYLEGSRLFKGRTAAILAGKASDQIAIYDIAAGQDIVLANEDAAVAA